MDKAGLSKGSKLGAVLPRHASTAPRHGGRAMLTLAREALRPPVASLPSRGAFAPPVHPTTRNPARFLRPSPTLRGLDARQRCVPLHRQSGFRARHHDEGRACPIDPAQPCAGWMRGNGISRCIDIRGLSPKPRVSGFARRHQRPAPCRAGLAAGARPLHPDP